MKEIALHVLDIAENGIAAGATAIGVGLELRGGMLVVEVEDNGRGMNEEVLNRVEDPFFTSRTTRRVGLGIPLLKQQAEMAGGGMELQSEAGKGTRIVARFQLDHPDRQPLGDLEGVWLMLVGANPSIGWQLKLRTAVGEFSLNSEEIKAALEVDFIRGAELTGHLKRMIRNNMDELGIG